MKLSEITIRHFGKFHDTTYQFSDHINILYGKNGAGKSTMHAFIRGMLFGMERKRGRAACSDEYRRYMPWNASGDYGGSIRLEHNGNICQITRNFLEDARTPEVFDETRSKPYPAGEDFISQMQNGLTEVTFDNTVSIGQMRGETAPAMADELKNYISNLHSSGSGNIDVAAAVNALTIQKKQLASQLISEKENEYDELQASIQTLRQKLQEYDPEGRSARLHLRRQQMQDTLAKKTEEYESLSGHIQEWTGLLKSNGIESAEQLRQTELAADRACSAYFRYKKAYRFTRHPLMRLTFLILAIIMFVASFFVIFLTNTNFSNDHYLPVPFLTILCILFFAAGRMLLAIRHRGWLWNQAREQLRNLFSVYLGDREIHPSNYDKLRNRLTASAAMMDKIERCRLHCGQLASDIQTLRNEENQILREMEDISRTDWENEQVQRQLTDLLERQELLQAQRQKNESVSLEIKAVTTAISAILSIAESYHVSFVPRLNQLCSEILSSLTGGAYDSMAVDENLNIYIRSQKRNLSLQSLSQGTIEQVRLSLRLALVSCFWPDHSVPLFLDDSFALYDDERAEKTLLWLAQNYKGQIFLFTCHNREEKLLNMHNIKHTFIEVN